MTQIHQLMIIPGILDQSTANQYHMEIEEQQLVFIMYVKSVEKNGRQEYKMLKQLKELLLEKVPTKIERSKVTLIVSNTGKELTIHEIWINDKPLMEDD